MSRIAPNFSKKFFVYELFAKCCLLILPKKIFLCVMLIIQILIKWCTVLRNYVYLKIKFFRIGSQRIFRKQFLFIGLFKFPTNTTLCGQYNLRAIKKMSELLKPPSDDSSLRNRVPGASDKISSPFPRERTVSSPPCPSQHDSFILVSVLFLDTGVLNLTLHLRRPPSVYFHPFHTVDEARRRGRRNSERESSRRRVSVGPDREWTEKRLEHERNRESGRVTTLGMDEPYRIWL